MFQKHVEAGTALDVLGAFGTKIIQYSYGDDNFDPIKIESQSMPFLNMTLEELYWWRVERLWTMYNSITNDEVYKSMWERKLKELLLRGFRGE